MSNDGDESRVRRPSYSPSSFRLLQVRFDMLFCNLAKLYVRFRVSCRCTMKYAKGYKREFTM